jgi:2-iminobutanoate/2-iminopropanoate deaminase
VASFKFLNEPYQTTIQSFNHLTNLVEETQMKKIIATDKAPAAIGPYCQAVQFGNLLFVSGQIALNPQTGEIVEGEIEAQTKQVLENLKAIIEEAGMTLQNVLKCSCFLNNMENFVRFNSVYDSYFSESLPARETVEVARLPKDVLVEVSAICGLS